MSHYQAWRFLHPDFDVPGEGGGLRIAPSGGIDMVAQHASVRQAILLLLSTRMFERVMRPDYGCELHKLVFSPNDETTAGLAIHYVKRALDRWEPRIEVVRLDATASKSNPGQLNIMLDYRLKGGQQREHLVFSIDLMAQSS